MDELLSPQQEPEQAEFNFATVGNVYEDGLSLIFDGQEEESEKHYKCNTAVAFQAGDRVRIFRDSGTYVVEYVVGNPGSGGDDVHGIPSGGAPGTVLTKNSATDFDAIWADLHGIPEGGSDGQFLVKDGPNTYAVKWTDAPHDLPAGGTAGQMLMKSTSADYAVSWTNVPSGVPSGGTTGQVLTKTASGFGWAAAPTEIPTSGTTGYVLTKTASGFGWAAAPTEIPTSGTTGYVLTKQSSGFGWAAVPDASNGLPTGGSTGQVLVKSSGANYAATWGTPGSITNQYNSGASYVIQFRTTTIYGTPSFQIRMGPAGTWKTITTT